MTAGALFINGRFLGQPLTGVQRYARETLAALDRLLPSSTLAGLPCTLLAPAGTIAPPLQHIAFETVGRRTGHAWEQVDLPRRVSRGLLLGFGFTGPLALRRQIVTLHDAAVLRVPQSYRPAFRWGYRGLVSVLARRAARVLAVSGFGAAEARACFGAPPARLRLVTEGWQHMTAIAPDFSVLDRHALRDQPFLLAVSSPTPSKNFALIERALALMGADAPRCVVVGDLTPGLAGAPADRPASMQCLGRVADGELKALYASARAFVFPSLYEGFGIPPLEAMSCGCPVLASTAPAVVETCADAALYFDPTDPLALASAIRSVWTDAALRSGLAAAAQRRLACFSWERGARMHLDIIEELM